MNNVFKSLMSAMLILALTVPLMGCGGGADSPVDYRITVCSDTDQPMEGIKVFVYEDETCAELVSVATTDATGTVAFTEKRSDSFTAVLKKVPAGYEARSGYTLEAGENRITLTSRPLTDEEMAQLKLGLGDRFPELTVTDCAGTEHSLYTLLEQKKAVVLNFWYENCGPCKMEFPYLQEAYEAYGQDVEFLALNPVDGTDDSVRAYQTQQNLTFPMAKCDIRWQDILQLTAYPTTVIVDRDGTIVLRHNGMVTDSEGLKNALAYFTKADYQPTVFETFEEIPPAE